MVPIFHWSIAKTILNVKKVLQKLFLMLKTGIKLIVKIEKKIHRKNTRFYIHTHNQMHDFNQNTSKRKEEKF